MEVVVCLTFLLLITLFSATLYKFTAVQRGVEVCLSGKPTSYSHFNGFGNGSINWILFFEIFQKKMGAAWLCLLISSVLVLINNSQVHATNFTLTFLENAVAKGAVCLDGSSAAYYYSEGFGDGVCKWIVYLEGGGYCNSTDNCVQKSKKSSGTSLQSQWTQQYYGLIDDDCVFNPDFCQWHKLYIHYCDGSSFSSNIESVDPRTNLTFRGARIFNATIDEFLPKGLGNASNAILAGSSAGGLSTILHCDMFRALLPSTSKVKCISDSGFFIRGDKRGLPGIELRETAFGHDVVKTHELANALPASCTSKRNPDLCLFAEYLVGDIQTPLFIIESSFDLYQVQNNLLPAVASKNEVDNCIFNIARCNATLIKIMKDFRVAFIKTLMKLNNSSSRGMFVHSCFRHVHIVGRDGWTCSSVECNVLANKTIGQAVGDWYFDRSSFHEIDIQKDSPFDCTRGWNEPKISQKCLAIQH